MTQKIPILEARQLTKVYRAVEKELIVLNDVSLTVAPGASCAILGPSGSGKTTLLGLCAGLDNPTSGSVLLDGHEISPMPENDRARMRNAIVGFVFQNFQLIPSLTALENVMVPAELRGQKQSHKRAVKLLENVGLGDRLGHYPAQLSGGEQQRVGIARAFINDPKILFADEPTGNLDAETSQTVTDLLFELNQACGTALVVVTHDPELARRAETTLRLRGGRQVE